VVRQCKCEKLQGSAFVIETEPTGNSISLRVENDPADSPSPDPNRSWCTPAALIFSRPLRMCHRAEVFRRPARSSASASLFQRDGNEVCERTTNAAP
jgi:hypothetical protein